MKTFRQIIKLFDKEFWLLGACIFALLGTPTAIAVGIAYLTGCRGETLKLVGVITLLVVLLIGGLIGFVSEVIDRYKFKKWINTHNHERK